MIVRRIEDVEKVLDYYRDSHRGIGDMAICKNKFYANREEVVRFVEYGGQFVLDNADDIVGDMHCMAGIDIVIHVGMDELPTVNIQRSHQVANWDVRRKSIKISENKKEV